MLKMLKSLIQKGIEGRQRSVNREIEKFYLDNRHRYIK